MHKYEYLDKRNKDEIILRFEACETTQEATEKCFNIISNSSLYKLLSVKFPKKYIETYFKKKFYLELYPVSTQIKIHNWENENKINNKTAIINTSTFSFPKIISNIYKNTDQLKFKHGLNFKKFKKNIIHLLVPIRSKYLNLKNFFKKKPEEYFKENTNCVAINYREGISEDKRSDLFWLYNSGINIPNIILYIESFSFFKRYKEEKKIEDLGKKKNFKIIKIWELDSFKKKIYYTKIKKELHKTSSKNYIDKILLKHSIDLLNKIEFWHSFFEKYKIKIHFDHNETEVDLTIKQIALILNDSCSIGKARSYYCNGKGVHFNHFPFDIFCTWGKKSIKNLKDNIVNKTEPDIKNILITGYPYTYITGQVKSKIKIIEEKMNVKKTRFNLLLLDNGAGHNKNYIFQLLPYELLYKFYKFFFNWVIEDEEVGLIIKPKRFSNLTNSNIEGLMKKAINTGRCSIEEESFGSIPWHYSKLANMIVSISTLTVPTALLECLINNRKTRGVFFDYPNLKKLEPDLYSWGKDRVVFNNMDKMLQSVKKYKSDQQGNNDIGNWPENFVNGLDAHMDNKFSNRACNYVSNLLKGFDEGLNKSKAIDIANKDFAQKWGKENIFISNN
jgi:hypothetical protein